MHFVCFSCIFWSRNVGSVPRISLFSHTQIKTHFVEKEEFFENNFLHKWMSSFHFHFLQYLSCFQFLYIHSGSEIVDMNSCHVSYMCFTNSAKEVVQRRPLDTLRMMIAMAARPLISVQDEKTSRGRKSNYLTKWKSIKVKIGCHAGNVCLDFFIWQFPIIGI